MNDKQISLEILLDCHKASRNQTTVPRQKENEKLKDMDQKDYHFNCMCLKEHDLLHGTITAHGLVPFVQLVEQPELEWIL